MLLLLLLLFDIEHLSSRHRIILYTGHWTAIKIHSYWQFFDFIFDLPGSTELLHERTRTSTLMSNQNKDVIKRCNDNWREYVHCAMCTLHARSKPQKSDDDAYFVDNTWKWCHHNVSKRISMKLWLRWRLWLLRVWVHQQVKKWTFQCVFYRISSAVSVLSKSSQSDNIFQFLQAKDSVSRHHIHIHNFQWTLSSAAIIELCARLTVECKIDATEIVLALESSMCMCKCMCRLLSLVLSC